MSENNIENNQEVKNEDNVSLEIENVNETTNKLNKNEEQTKSEKPAPVSVEVQIKNKNVEKAKKKEEKNLEQTMRSLKPEEKVTLLTKKYLEVLGEKKRLEINVRELDRLRHQAEQEKKHLVMANSRLESLSRELQNQLRESKKESAKQIREISARMQIQINELGDAMNQTNECNTKLREDNLYITEKFKGLCEQLKEREDHMNRTVKNLQHQKNIAEATAQQCNIRLAAVGDVHEKEKAILRSQLEFHKNQTTELEKCVERLKHQLDVYKEKYEEFQSAFLKSNNQYETFRSDMEKMSKQIQQVQMESNLWKGKWEHADRMLVEAQQQKDKKNMQLENLCRTMQTERTKLYKFLERLGYTSENINLNEIDITTTVCEGPATAEQTQNNESGSKRKTKKIKHKTSKKTSDTVDANAKQKVLDVETEDLTAKSDTVLPNNSSDSMFHVKEEALRIMKDELSKLQEHLLQEQNRNNTSSTE